MEHVYVHTEDTIYSRWLSYFL